VPTGAPPPDEVREVFGPVPVSVEPMAHAVVATATAGMSRVRAADGRSAVVKVLAHAPGGDGNWRSGGAVDHWYYWRREALAYGSGLLATLAGGLRAPVCHLVAERPDGSVALWLEDLPGPPGPTWSLDRYRLAARHLGRAQGEFVAGGRALPDDPWLSRHWLRDYLAQRDGDRALLDDPDLAAWRHPLLAGWFPDPAATAADLARMRADQDALIGVLDGLPATLCHLDLHPANLFAAAGGTVAIDWAFVGQGALGEDAGNLVPDAVFDFHVPPARLDDLHDVVAAAYRAGLADAGAAVSDHDVRLALAVAIAAKYAWIGPALIRAVAEGRDQLNRHPLAQAVAAWAPAVHYLLARAAEARAGAGIG
jgi:hypothetical protein